MISKSNFKQKLDEFIKVRDLPKNIYSYLRDIGFETRPYDFLGFEEEGRILSYEDRIILVIKQKSILLVDPIHDVKDETGWNPTLNSLEDDEEKLSSKKMNEQQVLENRNN